MNLLRGLEDSTECSMRVNHSKYLEGFHWISNLGGILGRVHGVNNRPREFFDPAGTTAGSPMRVAIDWFISAAHRLSSTPGSVASTITLVDNNVGRQHSQAQAPLPPFPPCCFPPLYLHFSDRPPSSPHSPRGHGIMRDLIRLVIEKIRILVEYDNIVLIGN